MTAVLPDSPNTHHTTAAADPDSVTPVPLPHTPSISCDDDTTRATLGGMREGAEATIAPATHSPNQLPGSGAAPRLRYVARIMSRHSMHTPRQTCPITDRATSVPMSQLT